MTPKKKGGRGARASGQAGAKGRNRSGDIKVRMYNVGFGDSFLITLPTSDGVKRVLVDCGSHNAGPGPRPIAEIAADIVTECTEDGQAAIDVVIATHRHQDHVSGFAAEVWDRVHVREVWMPWTEDPTDPQARKIRETQSRVATHLQMTGAAFASEPDWMPLAVNALSNAKAMQTLHDGFLGQPRRRFLPQQGEAILEPACLPGVTVHVLGPSRDSEVIRDMDPPAGHSYLRLMETRAAFSSDDALPFHAEWSMNKDVYGEDYPNLALKSRELEKVNGAGSLDELAVAVALDKAVNGTSLLLVLRLGKAHILLTGDAQWGTWNTALQNPQWRELLTKTTFHKVGHHGSHNASPKDLVDEVLGKDFWAMVSTRAMKRWKYIPKTELLTALRKKTARVVRSDIKGADESREYRRVGDAYVEVAIPT